MCSPTWITEKELERDIINKGERISLEEVHKNFIAAVSNASGHQGENERR